ncbi:MAG: hypothetical protein M1833_002616 [Piccolia ochrophora]|nr:MAG: hypothetical protein M1833_002616 [Piccolia ochrophora]
MSTPVRRGAVASLHLKPGTPFLLVPKFLLPSWNTTPSTPQDNRSSRWRKTFTTSTPCLKRAGGTIQTTKSPSLDAQFEPTALKTAIELAQNDLHQKLSDIHPSGRLEPSTFENLRVKIDTGKSKNVTAPLSDVAQVIPRGRILSIIVGDKAHLKSITSAIQSSSLNLTPQLSSTNPQELTLPIPAATAETREDAHKRAKKVVENATIVIGNARKQERDRLKKMEVAKKARPDDLFAARAEVERVIKAANEEFKKSLGAWEKRARG